ncbi:hypothetical protein C8R44DRAFT_890676 [Mycena epipterygia]|nr:hypothetical protein C8R44DRAFT_890676 [Mycena epipterygia]
MNPPSFLELEGPTFGMQSQCWKCGIPPAVNMGLDPLPTIPRHLAHLFSCNDASLDAEIPTIRTIIESSQNRLNFLDSHIHALQSSLARLIEERTETAEFVRHNTAVLSPFRRVPPELIC